MKYSKLFKNSYEDIEPSNSTDGCNKLLIGVLAICGIVCVVVVAFAGHSGVSIGINSNRLGAAEDGINDVLVELNKGTILGKRMISRGGREYLAFLGIPYAKPPLGELRFLPPVKGDPWNETLDATAFKPLCIQKDKYNQDMVILGSEDCLYLNIYTPKTMETLSKRSNRFPVMVLIHGGAQFGNGNRYGAQYFMDEDVILITFHYRIGVFGNLNTMGSDARGNQGYKDQVMALKWVKENIQTFGGNARKVTIFGNSGGGIAVSMHILSPMSTGLFQRVICQSGSAIMPTILEPDPLKIALRLGKQLNCTGSTASELVDCFRNIEAKKIILSSFSMMEFQTTVEPPAESDDVFLPDSPIKILQNGDIKRVAAIFGSTSAEGLFFSLPILTDANLTQEFNEDWVSAAEPELWFNNPGLSGDPEEIVTRARDFYLGPNDLGREVERNFTAMFTDRRILHPAHALANFQVEKNRAGRENVYLYYFNEKGDKSYADSQLEAYGTEEYLGAAHGDELQFLFPYEPYPEIPLDSKQSNFSQMLIRLWVSFANTGEPTGAVNGAEWFPISKEKPYKWFEIKAEPGMIGFLGKRTTFWDSFNLTDLYV